MKVLVWRLEQIAVHTSRPDMVLDEEKTMVGESVYMPLGGEEIVARAAAFTAAAATSSSKRKQSLEEDDAEQQPLKKARAEGEEVTKRLLLMRCSGRTKKDKACQMKKRIRLPLGQRWNCGRH
jgi:hypothetical protein